MNAARPDDDAEPAPPSGPRRVRVVGNSGAGKTTFARAVAERLGLPHVELDEVFWDEGWTHRDPVEARARLTSFLAGPGAEGWVVDGNWNTRLDGMLDDADTVAWLDFSRRVVMARVIRRTIARGMTRRELWHGNRERLTNLLRRSPDENIVLWSWTQHANYREQYATRAATDDRVVRLRTPREARGWLNSLG